MGECRVWVMATFSCMAVMDEDEDEEELEAKLCGLLRVEDEMVVARNNSGCNLLSVAGEGLDTWTNSILAGFLGTNGGGPFVITDSFDAVR